MNNQAAFAQALLDPDLPCPSGLCTWNGSDPARRFAVYRNNVVVSLIDALADIVPGRFRAEIVGGLRRSKHRSHKGSTLAGANLHDLVVGHGIATGLALHRIQPAGARTERQGQAHRGDHRN